MHTGEEGMTRQEPIERGHDWLTLINRHSGERLQMRRIRRDGASLLQTHLAKP